MISIFANNKQIPQRQTKMNDMMQKYRKKPVVIEAIQILPENRPALIGLSGDPGRVFATHGRFGVYSDIYVTIHTLEGTMTGEQGDWIIKGIKGELYPCKNDIFQATYEKVSEI